MEIIHEDAMTPHRIYAMVALLVQNGPLKRRQLFDLLQPNSIFSDAEQTNRGERQDAASRNFRAARNCGLVSEADDKDKTVSLNVPANAVGSFESFRSHMQSVLLGKSEEGEDQFLLNQFTAWYAVKDEAVFAMTKAGVEARFNEELYPGRAERAFRERSNFNAWRTWAEFLGFGWALQLGSRRDPQFVPDATLRLEPLLPHLLPKRDVSVPLSTFMEKLGRSCPELDGGGLFERCWQASRGNEVRGNRLSLMLSTALRVLESRGEIGLIQERDAADNWTLFRAQSYGSTITHIQRKAKP